MESIRQWCHEQFRSSSVFTPVSSTPTELDQMVEYVMNLITKHSTQAELFEEMKNLYGDSIEIRNFVMELWLKKEELLSGKKRNTTKDVNRYEMDNQMLMSLSDKVKVKMEPIRRKGGQSQTQPAVPKHQPCHCNGRVHSCFTNCLCCGRIFCVQEGEGICFYCGSYVTKQQTIMKEEFINWMHSFRKDNNSTKVHESKIHEGLEKAKERKAKLLQYARESVERTSVIDEQNDFYEYENVPWIGKEERQERKTKSDELMAQLDGKRSNRVDIDLLSGTVKKQNTDPLMQFFESTRESNRATASTSSTSSASLSTVSQLTSLVPQTNPSTTQGMGELVNELKTVSRAQYYTNDTLRGRAKEVYDQLREASLDARIQSHSKMHKVSRATEASILRVQHNYSESSFEEEEEGWTSFDQSEKNDHLQNDLNELRITPSGQLVGPSLPPTIFDYLQEDAPSCANSSSEMNEDDPGVCLSMHQPWASLLVLGIKTLEGRGWYSQHRGRLWIASASHDPTPDEIAVVEEELRAVYGPTASIPFPSSYPKSALLGCVTVVDVLSNEELQKYRKERGLVEDSSAQYVFISANPQILSLPYSITGQHKLWNLPSNIVNGLQASLKTVPIKWRLASTVDSSAAGGDMKTLDLWPSFGSRVPIPKISCSITPPTILSSDVVILKKFLSITDQQSMIDVLRPTSLTARKYDNSYFEWSLGKGSGRSENGSSATRPKQAKGYRDLSQLQMNMPQVLLTLFERISGEVSKFAVGQRNTLPTLTSANTCIARYFTPSSVPIRSQSTKPFEYLSAATVVCVGEAMEWTFNKDDPSSSNSVRLQSGDVLLLSAAVAERSLVQGALRILNNTTPKNLFFRPGHLECIFLRM